MRKTKFIQNLEKTPLSPLAFGYQECAKDPSVINLGTAESHLIDDYLLPLAQSRPSFSSYNFTYSGSFNTSDLEKNICSLYKDHFNIKDCEPGEFCFGSGISLLVQCLGLVLCEEGDVVLIPKPCYGCFEPDMQMSKCKVEYIDLNNLPSTPPPKTRLLLLTNPGNPLGDRIKDIDKLLKWAYQNPDVHVVTDEVYALSNRKGEPFKSIVSYDGVDKKRTHHLYGISKDWGLAGYHVGIFWSKNKEMVKMMNLAKGCFSLSSDTIYMMNKIWENKTLRDEMIMKFQERLKVQFGLVTRLLKEGGIEFLDCDNSLFIMINLEDLAGDEKKEMDLFMTLIKRFKVHILPGLNGFRYEKPGWFRLCYTMQENVLVEGMKRLVDGVTVLRKEAKDNEGK